MGYIVLSSFSYFFLSEYVDLVNNFMYFLYINTVQKYSWQQWILFLLLAVI